MAVLLVGSAARRSVTAHSDINFIVLVKGQDEADETVRVAERVIDIRYRNYKLVDQELGRAVRLPPLLRKARVLFEHEALGIKLVEKAVQRFRQGPPPASVNERIRLKAQCLRLLGKADDLQGHAGSSHYLLARLAEELFQAFFRLRGFWLTAPPELLRFVQSRDPEVGELFEQFLIASDIPMRLSTARIIIEKVFQKTPGPARID